MMTISKVRIMPVVLGILLLGGPVVRAQVYSGSLTGVASDPSGAVVPGAQAALTDEEKGFKFTALVDAEGRYVLRNLPPGIYRLTVSAPGMRTYIRPGITLTVGQNAQVDVKFELQGANCFDNVADPCTSEPNTNSAWSGSLNFNRTFSPTLVSTVTYGYARSFTYTRGVAANFPDFNPVTTLGLPPYILTSGYIATPNIELGNGYQAAGGQALGSRTFSILQYPLDTHTLNTSLNKINGKHEFKFGYELRMHRISFLQVGNPEGNYSFTLSGTSRAPSNNNGGDALASLLIGFPQGGNGYGVDAEASAVGVEAVLLRYEKG